MDARGMTVQPDGQVQEKWCKYDDAFGSEYDASETIALEFRRRESDGEWDNPKNVEKCEVNAGW